MYGNLSRSTGWYPQRGKAYKRISYSNETTSFNTTTVITAGATPNFPSFGEGASNMGLVLVAPVTNQGKRKCKNFTLSISTKGNSVPLVGVLVYVPEGTNPSTLLIGNASQSGASLYEPNQNVIMQFVLNPVGTTFAGSDVQRFYSRLARNLDSGDRICLILVPAVAANDSQDINVTGTLNYAISY